MKRSDMVRSLDRYAIKHTELTDPVTLFNSWTSDNCIRVDNTDFALFLLRHAENMLGLRQEEIIKAYCL